MGADRWWVANVWLWFMVAANLLSCLALMAAFSGYAPASRTPVPTQIYALLASATQIACIFAILKWQRWGWWGLLVVGLITFGVNYSAGRNLVICLLGLLGVGLTYLALRGGRELAVWPRLQ
jgi:hypothetical protein